MNASGYREEGGLSNLRLYDYRLNRECLDALPYPNAAIWFCSPEHISRELPTRWQTSPPAIFEYLSGEGATFVTLSWHYYMPGSRRRRHDPHFEYHVLSVPRISDPVTSVEDVANQHAFIANELQGSLSRFTRRPINEPFSIPAEVQETVPCHRVTAGYVFRRPRADLWEMYGTIFEELTAALHRR